MRRPIIVLMSTLLLQACGGPGSVVPQSSLSSADKVMDAAMQAAMPDVALRLATEQVTQNPQNAEALARQGDAYRAMGQDAAAQGAYARAVVIDPSLQRAQLGLGALLLHRDPAQAEAAFRRVLAASAQNPQALTGLGIARDLQNDHEGAQASYRAALAMAPDLRAAQVDLGLSLALSGHGGDGVTLLRPLASAPQADRLTRDNLAFALASTGQSAEAASILHEEMPDDAAARTLAFYHTLF